MNSALETDVWHTAFKLYFQIQLAPLHQGGGGGTASKRRSRFGTPGTSDNYDTTTANLAAAAEALGVTLIGHSVSFVGVGGGDGAPAPAPGRAVQVDPMKHMFKAP